jgi:hypothetical protein
MEEMRTRWELKSERRGLGFERLTFVILRVNAKFRPPSVLRHRSTILPHGRDNPCASISVYTKSYAADPVTL